MALCLGEKRKKKENKKNRRKKETLDYSASNLMLGVTPGTRIPPLFPGSTFPYLARERKKMKKKKKKKSTQKRRNKTKTSETHCSQKISGRARAFSGDSHNLSRCLLCFTSTKSSYWVRE